MKRLKLRSKILIICGFCVFSFSCLVLNEGLGNKSPIKKPSPRPGQLPEKHPNAPEYFAICSATLDGKNFTEILKDPRCQVSHPRVTEDHKWITFSRFTRIGKFGVALEGEGYAETEIARCKIDGSDVETIVPSKPRCANFNAYWTPSEEGLIYITTDNPTKLAQAYIIDLATRKRIRVPTPTGLIASDPQIRGDLVVYPGAKPGNSYVIHIMNKDGTNDRRLATIPEEKSFGEFDPKISPDKSKVVFTRYMTKEGDKGPIHIIVVDIKTGVETDLSRSRPRGNKNWDSFAEWSSDGKLLIFWHLNRKNPNMSGLYTIRPDGSERRKIPLPKGYDFMFAAFWPGTGSGSDAKIIFAARRLPLAIRRKLESLEK